MTVDRSAASKPTKINKKATTANKAKVAVAKYRIICTVPASDRVIETKDLEKFLRDNIKVENKTANLGNKVSLTTENYTIFVTAEMPFSKRYLKYLTRKYLKRQQIRDYLRVVAAKDRNSYEIKFYPTSANDLE